MAIYFIQAGASDMRGVVKIGSSANPLKRLNELQSAVADDLSIIRLLDGTQADERLVHAALSHLHIRREMFAFGDEMLTRNFGLPDLALPRFETVMPSGFVVDTGAMADAASHLRSFAEMRTFWMLPRLLNWTDFRPLNQARLGAALNLSGAAISRAMRALQSIGYIERQGSGTASQWRLSRTYPIVGRSPPQKRAAA